MTLKEYEKACEQGYDGPSPFQMKRDEVRRRENAKLDPRDPDYIDEEQGEDTSPICEICEAQDGTINSDNGMCYACYSESDDFEED